MQRRGSQWGPSTCWRAGPKSHLDVEGGMNKYESRERYVSSLLYRMYVLYLFGPVRGEEKGNRTFSAITTLIIINHTQCSVHLYNPPELRPDLYVDAFSFSPLRLLAIPARGREELRMFQRLGASWLAAHSLLPRNTVCRGLVSS